MTGFLCVMTVLQKFMGESVMSVNIADLSLSSVRGCSAASAEHGPAREDGLARAALPAMEGVLLPEEAIARVDIEPPRRQDLPPAVALELRKDETVRCGVCRQVEKVLGEGGQVDAALSRMEQLVADKPDSVTGEMLVLMEQARSARAAREVHGAAVSLKESMAASAEEMSLADGRMGKSDVSASADALLKDGDVRSDPAGGKTQEILVSDDLWEELEIVRDGEGVLAGDAALEDMKRSRERLETLRERVPGTSAASLPVRVALDEKVFQLDRAISSRERLNAALAALDDAMAQPLEERASLLDTLLRDMLFQFREQAEASERIKSPELSEALAAESILEQRGGISPRDAQKLEEALCRGLEKSLAEFAKKNDVLSLLQPESFQGVGRLCLDAGVDMLEMGRTLADCLRHIPGEEDAPSVLLKTALKGMTEGSDASRLQYVDMLFQGAYPERADTALLLKQAVVRPESREGVVCQHELVQSLRVIQHDILDVTRNARGMGNRGVGHGRTGTIHRAAGSMSARSFVLTPSLVKALNKHDDVDIPDLNYHMAHVALLQAKAESCGLLGGHAPEGKGAEDSAGTPRERTPLQTGVFRDWCEALGLDEETRTYASALAARLENPQTEARATRLLLEASERFNKGLKGTTTLDKAGRLVADTASMAVHRSSARHIHAMFQTSPEFLAREVLDKHIINLTGLIDANERLDIDETGLELNYDKVDAAMLEQMQTLKGNSEEGINGGEIQQTLQQALEARARTLRGLRARRGRFITGSKAMGEFARAAGESLELRAENARRHETLQNARMEKALMKFAWPHQIREREAVCRDVVRLAEVLQHLNENDPKTLRTLSSRGQTLAEERDSLLRRLADVDLHTMRHTGRPADAQLAGEFVETVLPAMLSRARAVLYFADGSAEEDQKAIRNDMRTLEKHQRTIFSFAGKAEKVFGRDVILRLETMVVAAMLRAFLEGGADAAAFSVRDPATLDAIKGHLKNWGLDADRGVMEGLVPMVLGNMTSARGGIDMARLRRENRQVRLSLAGRVALGEKARALRETGRGRLAARQAAAKLVSGGETLRDAFRREGVRGLMAGAARPGQGFVYDRTRGVVLDSGRVFSPLDSRLVTRLSVGSPLTARMEALRSNSMAVSNMGGGIYQVLLKGRAAVNVAAGLNIPLAAGFSVKAGAGMGGERSQGVALRFTGEENCRAFLEAFMDSESGLSDRMRNRELWLKADQIRFVNGSEVSANASLTASHALFSQKLGATRVLALTGTASLAFSGRVRQTLEESTHGETAVFERSGSVQAGFAASTGVKDSERASLSNVNPLARSTGAGFDMLQRFRVSTGRKGLMSDTCMELECGNDRHQSLQRLRVLLPGESRAGVLRDPALFDRVRRALQKAPPSARLVAHYELKPGLLEELRGRFIEARRAGDGRREELLNGIHERLASRDSYEPTRLIVRMNRPSPISKSYSPGLGGMRIVRSNTMLSMDSIAIDLRQSTAQPVLSEHSSRV